MRLTLVSVAIVSLAMLAACSDDDEAGAPADEEIPAEVGEGDGERSSGPRFCDAYLEYLADPTAPQLDVLAEAADDDEIENLIEIIETDTDPGRVLAADQDLDGLARLRCQTEWTAGAQGAGNTPAAAQAFFDAVVAGDRTGARNVASANAIAAFEPWEPLTGEDGTEPTLVEVGEQTFSIVLDAASLAQCQVETGVVIACTVAR